MAYLDRANIGNAKIEGMNEDLGLSDIEYNFVLSIFFVPYIIFGAYYLMTTNESSQANFAALLEIPSNTILNLVKRPSYYIGMIAMSWGTVMTLTGLVQNFGGLVAARVALGIAEYVQCSFYYPTQRRVKI